MRCILPVTEMTDEIVCDSLLFVFYHYNNKYSTVRGSMVTVQKNIQV